MNPTRSGRITTRKSVHGLTRVLVVGTAGFLLSTAGSFAESAALTTFRTGIQPVLKEFCYDCHGDGAKKGEVTLDEFNSDDALLQPDLWFKVLKNLRADIMPPPKKPQPPREQKHRLEEWIKSAVFQADPENPDPGRVTVRRLNRAEYRNTIRDLVGIDFETDKEFPPDDSGHGFDNIGDALTLSPMLLEKYLAAAVTIVKRAVPSSPTIPAQQVIKGRSFTGAEEVTRTNRNGDALSLSYYTRAAVSNTVSTTHSGTYQILLDFTATERFVDNQFDYNKARIVFKVDGKDLYTQEYTREGNKACHYEFPVEWPTGNHELAIEVEPLTPDQKQIRSLAFRIDSVTLRGPLEPEHWVRPKNYERFFGAGVPTDPEGRRAFARDLLRTFVFKAYRRPVGDETVERLVTLAEATYSQKGKTFEEGIGQAMVAVLASPRFLFREEATELAGGGRFHPLVDEYALASRLSYLFWSSMPDDELLRLAGENKLRENLGAQTKRLLDNSKSDAFVRNFVGQWLQTRDLDSIQIDARQVLGREAKPDPELDARRQRFRELRQKPETSLTADEKKELTDLGQTLFRGFNRRPRAELTSELRRAFREETEKTFDYVVRQDRPLLDLLNSDYTFLNERLAAHYGLTNLNILGEELRLVKLPPENPRGGVMTQGSVLIVTSNPTRTSPVKRGLFVLDNLLGSPPPPPPPDIPPLEDAAKAMKERTLTLRETLALHREQPLCSSCHNRMDPLGLALDNFNALGMWREQERGQPIDAAGKLLSGEGFTNIQELKQLLAANHSRQFYQTITEKLLTYALGRGLDYHDVITVDQIVERIERANGRPSALISGIVDSAPFQRTRALQSTENSKREPSKLRAELRTQP